MSGLRELSLERPLSTTNLTADQGNSFPSYFSFLHEHGPVLCLRLVYYIESLQIDCHSVRQITLVNGNYTKIFTSRRRVFAVYLTDRLAGTARLEPFTWQKATPPSRVPRASRQGAPGRRLPCLACERFEAFSKEMYEKLALPEWLG